MRLDCRGMRCPLPIIELATHIGAVEVGEIVVVVADDPAAAVDIPAWCRMRGQEFLGTEPGTGADDGGAPSFRVRRRR